MDADAGRRLAALEQELRRLQEEVEQLRSEAQEEPRGPSGAGLPFSARWLAWAGVATCMAALLLLTGHTVLRLGPATQVVSVLVLGLFLWGTGIYIHFRRPDASRFVAGAGVLLAAAAVHAAYALPFYRTAMGTTSEGAAAAMAAVAVAALLDAGARHVQSQAIIAAVLVPVTAAASLAAPSFSLAFVVVMSLALLATAAWQHFRGVPVVTVLGAGAVLLAHAAQGGDPVLLVSAATLLWGAVTALAWVHHKEADVVVQAVAWLATWGVGAWALAQWGVSNGWWMAAMGVVALRLSFAPAPRRMRRTWRAIGIVALVVFPVQLPWPDAVAAVWLLELAAAIAYQLKRSNLAGTAAVAGLTLISTGRLLAYEAPRIAEAAQPAAVATWLAAIAVLAGSWLVQSRRGMVLPRLHLALATGAVLLLVSLLLTPRAVGVAWMAFAAALLAEGLAARRVDLRVAGLASFAAAILHISLFGLAGFAAVWRMVAIGGLGFLLLGASWLYLRWERSVAPVP